MAMAPSWRAWWWAALAVVVGLGVLVSLAPPATSPPSAVWVMQAPAYPWWTVRTGSPDGPQDDDLAAWVDHCGLLMVHEEPTVMEGLMSMGRPIEIDQATHLSSGRRVTRDDGTWFECVDRRRWVRRFVDEIVALAKRIPAGDSRAFHGAVDAGLLARCVVTSNLPHRIWVRTAEDGEVEAADRPGGVPYESSAWTPFEPEVEIVEVWPRAGPGPTAAYRLDQTVEPRGEWLPFARGGDAQVLLEDWRGLIGFDEIVRAHPDRRVFEERFHDVLGDAEER